MHKPDEAGPYNMAANKGIPLDLFTDDRKFTCIKSVLNAFLSGNN